MKKSARSSLLLLGLLLTLFAGTAVAQVSVDVSIGGFYDELAPYGGWVDCDYGQCWVPAGVDAAWQPYSNGQWIYTDYGWTWVAYDPWGGDPFHYGTWIYLAGYGWAWVPGTVWAPAWVTWSFSDSVIGWAPLPPTVVLGVSGYVGSPVIVAETNYVFVPSNRFVATPVASARIPPQQNATIIRQTRPVTSFSVSGGVVRNMAIPVAKIQQATGTKIETRNIATAKTTPKPAAVPGGGRAGQMAVVAPAREVKAAVAGKPPSRNAPAQKPLASRPGNATPATPEEIRPNRAQPPRTEAEPSREKPNSASPPAARPAPAKPDQKEKKPPEKEKKPPENEKEKEKQNPPN
jgi:hypothetical protein